MAGRGFSIEFYIFPLIVLHFYRKFCVTYTVHRQCTGLLKKWHKFISIVMLIVPGSNF